MSAITKKFAQYLLSSQRRYVREQDLRNLCESDEQFVNIIKELRQLFSKLGISLIRTKYGNENYFVLTRPGKEADLSPELYGMLTLLLATYNELGKDIPLEELKEAFKEGWHFIEDLIKRGYLGIVERSEKEYLEFTPISKAIFKDIGKSINLKMIIDNLEKEEGN